MNSFTGTNPAQATPVSTLFANAPTYKLYDDGAVTLASFLGGPIPGTILMAANYRRLGKKDAAFGTVALGVLVMALVVGIGYFLPQTLNLPIGIGLIFGMRSVAKAYQGAAIEHHTAQGGQLGSKWFAFLVGMAFLILVCAIIFIPIFLEANEPRVNIDTGEIFYKGTATKEDATSLGNMLKSIGFFGENKKSVFLEKSKGQTIVSFVVREDSADKSGAVESFEEIGREVAPSVGGFPLRVRLITPTRDIKRDLAVGKEMIGSKDHIFYYGDATESDAKALGEALKTDGYFGDTGSSVLLSKDRNGTIISFVVTDGYWEDHAHVDGFERIVRRTAASVGGLPITMRLMNTKLAMEKQVEVR